MVLALMGIQALVGLLLPGHYRDTGYVAQTWLGNDLVTLILAVPLLLCGLTLEGRGRPLGRLLWLGGLGYALYNYAFYLLGAELNPLFPLYATLVVLAGAALILTISRTDADRVAASFDSRTPVRAVGGYMTATAVGLTLVWLGMWALYVFARRPLPVGPGEFRLVAGLDLTLMVPLLAVAGVLLWRRSPWGYVLAPLVGIQATLYLAVLAVNSLRFVLGGTADAPGEVPIWGGLTVLTGAATATLLRHAVRGPVEA